MRNLIKEQKHKHLRMTTKTNVKLKETILQLTFH